VPFLLSKPTLGPMSKASSTARLWPSPTSSKLNSIHYLECDFKERGQTDQVLNKGQQRDVIDVILS